MIVFDLRCDHGHVFEAWFGSSGAFDAQRAAGQVVCPICGTADVAKAVMAPAVGAKGNRGDAAAGAGAVAAKEAMRALAAAQARALAGSEWVGSGFATRARAMHAGEEAQGTIHGQATLADAKALVAEGVPIAPLPLPVVPPKQVN